MIPETQTLEKPVHSWLKTVRVAFVPGPMSPLLEESVAGMLEHFTRLGHTVQDQPDDSTDLILTTAPFDEPLNWRQSLLLTGRSRFRLSHNPTVFTLVHAQPEAFADMVAHFERALSKDEPDPADFDFVGLSPTAYRVFWEQGRRGGPIMALERLLQSWTKSIRLLLFVGENHPQRVYHFDLVGAFPHDDWTDANTFYDDIVLRIVTTMSTYPVTEHEVVGDIVPQAEWRSLSTPAAMRSAAQELGKRHFFTNTVRISDIVNVPAVDNAIASQYSEGCFATWDADLGALIATVTGSARPVDKDNIGDDDLAVIVGVRSDGLGALVRNVDGKRNDPPSSEAVEMMDMDGPLPFVELDGTWEMEASAPVVRSKLHGHRGVSAYNPALVEYVPLDPPYYHYLVSCATEAQARGVKQAFARSEALRFPDDPRQIVFTILPGHGLVAVEKWVPGTVPFQVLWEAMDTGDLVIESYVPQGPMGYVPDADGRMVLQEGNS